MARLLALPFVAILLGVIACGTSATDGPPTSTHPPVPTPVDSTSVATSRSALVIDQPEVGTDVGDILPHFEFTLVDGTRKSTAQLASEGQPVFLFFFATW